MGLGGWCDGGGWVCRAQAPIVHVPLYKDTFVTYAHNGGITAARSFTATRSQTGQPLCQGVDIKHHDTQQLQYKLPWHQHFIL